MLKKIIVSLFVIILLVVGFVGGFYYMKFFAANIDAGEGRSEAYVFIPTGSTFQNVKEILLDSGFVKDMNSFTATAELKHYTSYVKSGRFLLTTGMSNNDAINALRSKNTPINVTFNNISSFEKLAGVVGAQLEADSAAFIEVFSNPQVFEEYGFTKATFPAMFIPNTYEMYWNGHPEDFIKRMAKEFKSLWNDERKSKARNLGLSQSQVSTLASIVEAETKAVDEMPKVARLYLNRLAIGMPLQADPTVKFALNDPSIQRIYKKDLKVESPYNTYINKGLPPGPIAFPSLRAIDAVLNASEHSYLYMCAKPDYSGYHNFAKTLRQHNVNSAKYHAFLRQEGIR